jgi:hypothetical protein
MATRIPASRRTREGLPPSIEGHFPQHPQRTSWSSLQPGRRLGAEPVMRLGENTMSIVRRRAKVGTGPCTGQLKAAERLMEYSAPRLPGGMSRSARPAIFSSDIPRVSIWQSRCWRAAYRRASSRMPSKDEDQIVISDFSRSETLSDTNVASR